jgi:hypothetical protein
MRRGRGGERGEVRFKRDYNLPQTEHFTLFPYELCLQLKSLTNCIVPYLGLELTIPVIKSQIHLVRQSQSILSATLCPVVVWIGSHCTLRGFFMLIYLDDIAKMEEKLSFSFSAEKYNMPLQIQQVSIILQLTFSTPVCFLQL